MKGTREELLTYQQPERNSYWASCCYTFLWSIQSFCEGFDKDPPDREWTTCNKPTRKPRVKHEITLIQLQSKRPGWSCVFIIPKSIWNLPSCYCIHLVKCYSTDEQTGWWSTSGFFQSIVISLGSVLNSLESRRLWHGPLAGECWTAPLWSCPSSHIKQVLLQAPLQSRSPAQCQLRVDSGALRTGSR